MSVKVLKHENGPFLVNSYLVINETSNEAFILDPGHDTAPLLEAIEKENLNLTAIVATHGHLDHVEGVTKVQETYNVPFIVNDGDRQLIETIPVQAGMFGVPAPGVPVISEVLPLSGTKEVAGLTMELLHTPGHSPGSVSIKIENIVFSGDALFNFSIGRTDLPGGNYEELISSIKDKLFSLPDDTTVLPGHGPGTTIGNEKKMNPFLS